MCIILSTVPDVRVVFVNTFVHSFASLIGALAVVVSLFLV